MTRLLYEADPYLTKFDATVTKVQGEWVVLDRTAFFPGGGGQDHDTGWMSGLEVKVVRSQDGEVVHQVPGHALSAGDRVDCEVDWERRNDLMRAHTGEHLLFSILSRMSPELELVKIAITSPKKSLVVRGELSWPMMAQAQEQANEAIAAQLPVSDVWVSKNSEVLKDIRIKVDRIHGDKVRVVTIGDLDKAACAGVHIQNTRELKMLLVTKLTSARPVGDYEIEFETGRRAMQTALRLSSIGLQAAESVRAQPEHLLNALSNLKGELLVAQDAVRAYGRQALKRLEPEKVEGVRLYSGIFDGLDKKTLVDSINELIGADRTVAIMASVDERLTLFVATSKDLEIDSREVLNRGLKVVDGKGGGGKNFASGGASHPQRAKEALDAAKDGLRALLTAG
ncbi:MAG: alanine--tRNA ligase-related protein [Methanomassiliicoccales archaeon]|nr:alanine--tRNA ligase-related protein [Methanomassiliicoccales archaeon]